MPTFTYSSSLPREDIACLVQETIGPIAVFASDQECISESEFTNSSEFFDKECALANRIAQRLVAKNGHGIVRVSTFPDMKLRGIMVRVELLR